MTGRPDGLPESLVTMIEMASAGDPVMRDLAMQIAVLTSLPDGLPDDGSGTRKAMQTAIREGLRDLIVETLGPIDGPNGKVVQNLLASIEASFRATNTADRQRAIEREAFPAFHDAKVKARTDDLAAFLTETLITVTPVVSEVEAGYRAYRALNDYEAAIAAGDREAAAQSLLEFGTALTEAVPLGGRFAKATRFAPVLDKAKERVGKAAADLLTARTRRRSGKPDQSEMLDDAGEGPFVSRLDDDDRESLPRDTNLTLLDQGQEPTCGSTCVGMILKDLGKEVDLDDLAKQADVVFSDGPRAGTTMSKLTRTLRRNGVETARDIGNVTIDMLAEGTKGKHAAIVSIRVRRGDRIAGHAVIVDGVAIRQGRRVVAVRDPARGEAYLVPVEQFKSRMQPPYGRVTFVNPGGVTVK